MNKLNESKKKAFFVLIGLFLVIVFCSSKAFSNQIFLASGEDPERPVNFYSYYLFDSDADELYYVYRGCCSQEHQLTEVFFFENQLRGLIHEENWQMPRGWHVEHFLPYMYYLDRESSTLHMRFLKYIDQEPYVVLRDFSYQFSEENFGLSESMLQTFEDLLRYLFSADSSPNTQVVYFFAESSDYATSRPVFRYRLNDVNLATLYFALDQNKDLFVGLDDYQGFHFAEDEPRPCQRMNPVPEPSTVSLISLSLISLFFVRNRLRK